MATFVVGAQGTGRTNVPKFCANWSDPTSPNNDPSDDYPVFAYRWVSVVLKSKRVEGPGVASAVWGYSYSSERSWQLKPGYTQPVCGASDCAEPYCTSDDCAGTRSTVVTRPDGSWERYYFGNSYRYNEGKLLSHEIGEGVDDVAKTTFNAYNFATSGQPYAAQIGSSPQFRGGGFMDEYPRPLARTDVIQDGGLFTWEVAKGCAPAGGYCFDDLMRPTKVVKTGSVAATMGGATHIVQPTQVPVLSAPPADNDGQYIVTWTGSALATAYELQEKIGAGNWTTIQNSGANSRAFSSKGDGNWSYQVRGCNSVGCTDWSTTKTTVVTHLPGGVPVLSAPSSNTTGSYVVSWTAVSGASTYQLAQRHNGGSWTIPHNAAGTSIGFGAQAAGTYDYLVRACNAGGCADFSAMATTTVSLPLGGTSITVPASVQQDAPFTVSWTSVADATTYYLERRRENGTWSLIYSGASTSLGESLGLAGTYRYRVKGCNSTGCGPMSAEAVVVVESSTNAPQSEETDI